MVVGLIATALWLDLAANPPAAFCPSQLVGILRNATVIEVEANCQSTVSLPADSYKVYSVAPAADHMVLLGGYSSSATMSAYILNATELSALETIPNPTTPPPQYFWTSGSNRSYSLSYAVPPPPEQYYLVLENLHPTSVSLQWTETLEVVVAKAA